MDRVDSDSYNEHNVEDITQLNIKQKTLTINKHENVPKFLGALKLCACAKMVLISE